MQIFHSGGAATSRPFCSITLVVLPELNFKRKQELLTSCSLIPVAQNT